MEQGPRFLNIPLLCSLESMYSMAKNGFLVTKLLSCLFSPRQTCRLLLRPSLECGVPVSAFKLAHCPSALLVPGILLLPTPTSPLMSVPVTWEVGAQLIYLKEADDEETWAALLWGRCRLSCLRGRVGLQWCQILRESQLLALRASWRMLARTGVR